MVVVNLLIFQAANEHETRAGKTRRSPKQGEPLYFSSRPLNVWTWALSLKVFVKSFHPVSHFQLQFHSFTFKFPVTLSFTFPIPLSIFPSHDQNGVTGGHGTSWRQVGNPFKSGFSIQLKAKMATFRLFVKSCFTITRITLMMLSKNSSQGFSKSQFGWVE